MESTKCLICSAIFSSAYDYFQHMKVHKQNARLTCAIRGCGKNYARSSFFQHGVHRHHAKSPIRYVCSVESCSFEGNKISMTKHLYKHIENGTRVPCFFNCPGKSFGTSNSLRLHVRYHHNLKVQTATVRHTPPEDNIAPPEENITPPEDNIAPPEENIEELSSTTSMLLEESAEVVEESIESDQDRDEANQKSIIFMIGKVFLKMLSEKNITEVAMQQMADCFHEVASVYQELLEIKCDKVCQDFKLNELAKCSLKLSLVDVNIFQTLFDSKKGIFRTTYKRRQYFEKTFQYVSPVQISLGRNEGHEKRFYHYVPIKNTITAFLGVQKYYDAVFAPKVPSTEFKRDYVDGQKFRNDLNTDPTTKTLDLFLYQDCAEVVNPIGSARKKHKLLCCYIVLGNLEPCERALTQNIFLALLCKERDFTYFSPNTVFRQLVEDMKDLETNGIHIEGRGLVKARLFATFGDNLGAHQIASFTQNFSTTPYFCVYCESTLREFRACPHQLGKPRNSIDHQQYVEKAILEGTAQKGVKGKCIFDELSEFKMFDYGMAPCIAHDIFEGWASNDLFLIFKAMIKKKLVGGNYLNSRINSLFKKLKLDTNMQLDFTRKQQTLVGKAVDIWHLIQIIPLIFLQKDIDQEELLFQSLVTMKEIVDIITAPMINTTAVDILRERLGDYLELRKELFPAIPLRPKMHFTMHYPDLIRKFGPLMRFCTLACERKHSFFKRAIRSSQNFKNVTKYCSEKHQLYSAYLNSDTERLDRVLCIEEEVGNYRLLPEFDQIKLRENNLLRDGIDYAQKVKYQGHVLKEHDYLFLEHDVDCDKVFLEISLIIYDSQSQQTTIYGREVIVREHIYRGYRKILPTSDSSYRLQNIDQFIDLTPHSYFEEDGNRYLFHKHMIPLPHS